MKLFSLIIISCLYINSYSQDISFDTVQKRVSKLFFKSPEKAKKDAYLLKKIARKKTEIETSYKYLGYIHDLTGNQDSARHYLTARLNYTKKHFYNEILYYEAIISYVNWGLEYVDNKILIEELTTGLSSIPYGKFNQQKGLLFMLMGDVLLQENDFDSASTYFDKSFELIKGKYVPIDYYQRKSTIAIRKHNYIGAKELLLKGISFYDDKNLFTYPHFLNMLGYVSIMLTNYAEAEAYLQESLYYQKRNNFKTFTATTYLNLFYLAKQIYPEKEKYYLDLALIAAKNNPIATKDVYLAYKDYYSRKNDFNKEQVYYNKFTYLNDSIFNTEKAKAKLDLEWRYKLTESTKALAYKEQIIENDAKIKGLYALALILLVLVVVAVLVVFRVKIRAHRKNRKVQKMLHEEQLKSTLENQKSALIKEKIKAKFDERERLSLELHDGIASEISALKISLANTKKISPSTLDVTLDKIDRLYHEVRNLSHNLNPDSITEVHFSQLVDKICVIAENSGVKLTKTILISNAIDTLPEHVLLNLYRILQELINNLVKHSKATAATIEIIEDANYIFIEVSDNGVGIAPTARSGIGLKNIKKRVAKLNGEIHITNNSGTQIRIKIPL